MTEAAGVASRARGPRLGGLDGLRALAAGSILLYHCWLYSTPHGPIGGRLGRLLVPNLALGVTLFFTLSGFLLWRPFAAALLAGDARPPSLPYLRNRALRILPAYWTVLLLCAFVLDAALVRRSASTIVFGPMHDIGRVIDAGALLQNLNPATVENGLGPAWSLCVEVAFYLALPLLAIVAFAGARVTTGARGRRLAAALPAAVLLILGITGKLAADHLSPARLAAFHSATAGTYHYPADWHTVVMISPWAQADLFVFGILLAVVQAEVRGGRLALPAHWRRGTFAAACAVGLPALVAVRHHQLDASLANTAIALACALLLAPVVLEPGAPRASMRVLQWRPLVAVGAASYSVFLWNEPATRWLERHGLTLGGPAGLIGNAAIVVVVVGLMSAATYRLVERPALQRKARRTPRSASASGPPSASASAPTASASAPVV